MAQSTEELLQRWADGTASLKDVRGYTPEELFTISKIGYFLYRQGRLAEARTLFQGLYAVNPGDPYVATALGVVELAAGHTQSALQAYDVAVKLAPEDARALIGRAEIRILIGQKSPAAEDLRRALQVSGRDTPLYSKAYAMLSGLTRK